MSEWKFDPELKPHPAIANALRQAVDERMRFIEEHRDRLVEAWIAETGLKPSESMLIVQRMDDGSQRIWVERREEKP